MKRIYNTHLAHRRAPRGRCSDTQRCREGKSIKLRQIVSPFESWVHYFLHLTFV
ncbi:hypothetical protein Hanom_Chr05g00410041 [Helianthus anomalus]